VMVRGSREGQETVLLLVEFCQLRGLWGERKCGCLLATKRRKKNVYGKILKMGGRQLGEEGEAQSLLLGWLCTMMV